jgi:hypothetical protein
METTELVEISKQQFMELYTPKINPSTKGIIFTDILKHNPEYCYREDKKGRLWSVSHRNNDVYAINGIQREHLLGIIFTKVPGNRNEIVYL